MWWIRLCIILVLQLVPVHAANINLGVVNVNTTATLTTGIQDVTRNFDTQYFFTLTSPATAAYQLSTTWITCRRGCGNPNIESSLFNAYNNQAIASDSVVLSSGTYYYGVKGTGIGNASGSYSGTIFISPVPEPKDVALFVVGVLMLVIGVLKRNKYT